MQFSFMPRESAPRGDPQWQLSAHPERLTGPDRKAWDLSVRAARDVLTGAYPDPTGGASFYHHRTARQHRWWRSLRGSPYRSPNGENFFYQAPEEPARPLPPKFRNPR